MRVSVYTLKINNGINTGERGERRASRAEGKREGTLQTLMQEVRVGRQTEAVLIGLDTISVVRDIAYIGSRGKLHKPSFG